MKIKPLTFGQATFHQSKRPIGSKWREKVFQFSEKQDSVFWDIKGHLFCSFIEDGVPYLEAIKNDEILNKNFSVVKIGIESMTVKMTWIRYEDDEDGIERAKVDFEKGKLTSKFLTKSNKF